MLAHLRGPRPRLRLATLAALALFGAPAAPPALAADPPVITGLSTSRFTGSGPTEVTISGRGLSGVTAVFGGERTVPAGGNPFTIVSDRTIRATFANVPYGGSVQVQSGGGYSGVSQVTTFTTDDTVANASLRGSSPMTCTLGGGAPFSADLVTSFEGVRRDPLPQLVVVGRSKTLRNLWSDIVISDGSAVASASGARPSGDGRTNELSFALDGAVETSLSITRGAPYFIDELTGMPWSEDGNRVSGPLTRGVDLAVTAPATPGNIVAIFRRYRGTVPLSDGTTGTLDCAPAATAMPAAFTLKVVPVPTIAPATVPAAGGTRVRVTGDGFVAGSTTVSVNRIPVPVDVESSTSLTFVAPPGPNGPTRVSVDERLGEETTLVYVGSAPDRVTTLSAAATCGTPPYPERNSPAPVAILTATAPTTVVPGEAIRPYDMELELRNVPRLSHEYDARWRMTYTPTATGTSAASFFYVLGDPNSIRGSAASGSQFLPLPGSSSLGTVTAEIGDAVTLAGGTLVIDTWPFETAPNYTALQCTFDPSTPLLRIPVVAPSEPLKLGLAGSLALTSQARGTAAVKGAISGSIAGSAFSGSLTLAPTVTKLTAFGIVPVTAALQFVPVGDTSGTLSGGTLTTTSKVLVRVPGLRVLGISIVSSSCQAKAPSEVTLTATGFSTTSGGTLTGKLPINGLTGCGTSTAIASNLLTSSTNALRLSATPAAN